MPFMRSETRELGSQVCLPQSLTDVGTWVFDLSKGHIFLMIARIRIEATFLEHFLCTRHWVKIFKYLFSSSRRRQPDRTAAIPFYR